MFYSIEEAEKDIFNLENIEVKLQLPPGKLFNLYSDTADRSLDSSTVDDLKEKIDTYLDDNFVPDWIVADNPPTDKFVVYHCQLNNHTIPGKRIGVYTPNEDGVISSEELDEILSIDYGVIVLIHVAAGLCLCLVRSLN